MRCCDRLAGLMVGLLFILAGGCGKPTGTVPDAAATKEASTQASGVADSGGGASADAMKSDTPEAAVGKFLEAVRTGNDRTAEAMFTDLARERIKELDLKVTPPGSDTARFEVSKAELLAEDGARVSCKWTDNDKEGNAHTDDMTWMLRKQSQGWRVAGMAAVVFENEDPVLLDFENPKEALEKLKKLKEEVARRDAPQASEPRQAENPEEPVRR